MLRRFAGAAASDSAQLGFGLRWFSAATGMALLGLGAAGALFPEPAAELYGVPLSGGSGAAYLSAASVRDISLGGTLLAFAMLGDRRALGVTFLLGSVIAGGDGAIALRHSPAPLRVLPLHWGGAMAFWGMAYLLLRKGEA